MSAIDVTSEIKPLKEVLLHRPGNELLNLTPDTLERLLFDDIPYLEVAQKEHDEFAQRLKENGITVYYLEDLMTEVLNERPDVKEKFIKQFITEAGVDTPKYKHLVLDYLNNIENNKDLVLKTMEGIRINELDYTKRKLDKSLVDLVSEDSAFITDPMPNLYFTRDNFASIGEGISLNKMYSVTRNRETIYAEYIFNYHPKFAGKVYKYYDRYEQCHIEGGDVLNLNEHVLAVGISQRTEAGAIDQLAKNIFKNKESKIDTILAFNIPNSDEDLNVKEMTGSLEEILEKYLGIDITLIPCAGGDKIASAREQWNDGSNTLAIAPGVVVVYNRNTETNKVLREYGLKVIEISSAELSRGRGGPRCMSMPLVREK